MGRWTGRVLPLTLAIIFVLSLAASAARPDRRPGRRDAEQKNGKTETRNLTDPQVLYHRVHPGNEAVNWFRTRLAEKPDDAARQGDLAMALFKVCRHTEALIEAEAALARNPHQPWALLTAILVCQTQGRHERALGYQQRMLKLDLREFGDFYLDPSFIRLAIAWSQLQLGRAGLAEEELQTILAGSRPPSPLTLHLIERFHVRAGQRTRAVELYQGILDRDTREVNAWLALGRLELEAGRPASAEILLDRAVALDPRSLKPRFYRFLARVHPGEWNGEDEDLETVLAMDPDREEAREIAEGRITPFPGARTLYAAACLAAADWEGYHRVQRQLLAVGEDDAAVPFLKEEIFADAMDETCLRLHRGRMTPAEEVEYRHFVSPLADFLRPTDETELAVYEAVADRLRSGQAAQALKELEAVLEKDTCAPGPVLQGFYAARAECQWYRAWKLFQRFRTQVHAAAAREEADHYSPLVLLLDAVDPYLRADWMKDGSWYEYAGDLPFEEAWEKLGEQIAATDSLTTRTFLRLARMTLAGNFLRYDLTREDFDACLADDPRFFLARFLFDRFGRFMEL